MLSINVSGYYQGRILELIQPSKRSALLLPILGIAMRVLSFIRFILTHHLPIALYVTPTSRMDPNLLLRFSQGEQGLATSRQ
jgi:hypothetical protein